MKVTNNDWQTKTIKIENRTFIRRYKDKNIPTALMMSRMLNKGIC